MKDEVRLILNTCSQSQDQNWFFARNVANISSAQAGATKPNNNKPASGNGTDPTTPNPQPTTTPAPAPAAKPALNTTGKWSAPFDLGLSATSMAILGNGKVLIWAASTPTAYGGGVNTKVMVFDPATNRKANLITTAKEGIYDSTAQEYFCESTSILPGGGTIIAGGAAASRTSSTDALGNWKANSNLNIPRGYAASTTTSKGQVLVLGGSWNNTPDDKKGELYTAGSGWKLLNNVSTNQNFLTNDEAGRYRADNHMWLFGASNGYVFHAGPSKSMHWIDTNGDGTVVSAGTRGNDTDAMNGNAVMYDIGKILAVNGSMNYDDDLAPSSNATLIDISKGPGSAPQTKSLGNLKFARKFGHSIVLPNGQVMIVGGAGQGNHPFKDTAAVLTPELWDPATEKAQTMANHAIPRTYHSVGFLTVDGRVMIAGGGLGADTRPEATTKGEAVHLDAEIFTPPYLLNADGTDAVRPSIIDAPASTNAGQTITVTSTGATSFTLVRVSSATHSHNNDQRRIPLSPDGTKSTNASRAANTKGIDTTILKIPDDRGIVLPGTYYLFALDNRGTPSIASMINIQ
jgi:galactose oxidase